MVGSRAEPTESQNGLAIWSQSHRHSIFSVTIYEAEFPEKLTKNLPGKRNCCGGHYPKLSIAKKRSRIFFASPVQHSITY